jgi:hypothetical protein
MEVTIYLILMEDDGATGRPVGCGDSGVVSTRSVPATDSPLHAAMTELLSDERQTDDAGLYNSLYRSNLVVDSAEVGDDGTARVALSGELVLTGVCEDARIQAQLEETARIFSPSQTVEITINGSPIADVLGGRGPDDGSGTGTDTVSIFLIAMQDEGKSGPAVGCGDSAVAVTREIPATQGLLRAALDELLSIHDQYYGESGLYNALWNSTLAVDSVTIDGDGTAHIALAGELILTGVCEDARIQAQLEQTALQFSTVKAVEITVNDVPLAELLSGQG